MLIARNSIQAQYISMEDLLKTDAIKCYKKSRQRTNFITNTAIKLSCEYNT